jgi:hypothetical protein
MKRYLLFAGDLHRAAGGWADFVDSYATILEALERVRSDPRLEWYQIVDTYTATLLEAAAA